MKRPFAIIGFTFLIAQAAAVLFGLYFAVLLAALSLIAALIVAFIVKKLPKAVLAVLLSVCVASAIYSVYNLVYIKPVSTLGGESLYITGTVVDDPYEDRGRYYYVIKTGSVVEENMPKSFKLRLSCGSPLGAQVSDEINAFVKFNNPVSEEGFSSRTRMLSRGIAITGYCVYGSETIVTKHREGISWFFANLRSELKTAITRSLGDELAPLLRGLLLGDNSAMDSETVNAFRISGLSHLLAVSGLHLSILCAALTKLLRAFKIPRRTIYAVLIVFVLLFMGIVGFKTSVIRAGIMMLLYLTAELIKRDNDSLNSLGVAVFVLCLSSPLAAADIGFILSVAATFGLVTVYSPIFTRVSGALIKNPKSRRGKLAYTLISMLIVSLTATLFTLPFSALYFGSVSLISPLANLLCIIPATCFLLIGSMAALLFLIPTIGVFISKIFGIAAWCAGKLLLGEVKLLSGIPNAGVPVNYSFVPVLIICAALLFAMCYLMFRGKRGSVTSFLLCIAFCAQALCCGVAAERIVASSRDEISIYNMGSGNAVFIRSGESGVLVGCGGDSYMSWLMTLGLEDDNFNRLDALFLPALDKAQSSGAQELIERFKPRYVFSPSEGYYADAVFSAAQKSGSKLKQINGAQYKDAKSDIDVSAYCDSDGCVWICAKTQKLSALICPEKGNCLKLPAKYRTAHIAVVSNAKLVNAAYLDADAFIVSANAADSAEAELLLRYRGFERVYSTGVRGNIRVYAENKTLIIGGVENAGY